MNCPHCDGEMNQRQYWGVSPTRWFVSEALVLVAFMYLGYLGLWFLALLFLVVIPIALYITNRGKRSYKCKPCAYVVKVPVDDS